jgi:hypothetical protein
MKPDFAQYGIPDPDNLIQAFIGGSPLHGAKVGRTDDTDTYGVFIEPAAKMIGLDLFASRRHGQPVAKFADDPMERLCGRKRQKSIHRASLEQTFG